MHATDRGKRAAVVRFSSTLIVAHLDQVEVLQADGGEFNPQPTDALFINAGATHLRNAWLDDLRPGGRLLLPLTVSADPNATGINM